jgi:hypothetical protein
MEWIVLEGGLNPISPFACLKTQKNDRIVNIDKEKYEINNACMYIRVMISYVRKYSLCGFRKINTNLLYELTILIICKDFSLSILTILSFFCVFFRKTIRAFLIFCFVLGSYFLKSAVEKSNRLLCTLIRILPHHYSK